MSPAEPGSRPRSARRAYAVYLWLEGAEFYCYMLVFTAGALYGIQVANLDALQLVLVGTALEIAALVFEVPTGLVADTVSRRLSIIIGCLFIGAGFILWGLVPVFLPILFAQVLWGLGATFQSGATEAWIADELHGHDVGRTYLRASQLGYAAAALGIVSSALLGSAFGLAFPMVIGGIGFLVIAASLVAFMPEDNYAPAPRGDRSHGRAMADTLTAGIRTVRAQPVLLTILLITFLGAGASETFDRLWEFHILDEFTFPTVVDLPPIAWFGLISVIALLTSIGIAEVARRRVDTDNHVATARALLGMDAALMVAMVIFGLAVSFEMAVAAYLVARVMRRVTIPISTAWINQSLTPHVRATVMSLNAQTDAVGQIAGGPLLGALAVSAGTPAAMLAAAAFIAPSLFLYLRTIRLHGRDVIGDDDGTEEEPQA
ncbi:MAG TPA: MFS transporter [Candidatus Limnocylindria bacterium]|nr:MFS transporter [Candidatus Limnocylindria bacterium]